MTYILITHLILLVCLLVAWIAVMFIQHQRHYQASWDLIKLNEETKSLRAKIPLSHQTSHTNSILPSTTNYLDVSDPILLVDFGEKLSGNGIYFSRDIDILTDDLDVNFGFDEGHCDSTDRYGGNKCHYTWGETINIGINVDLNNNAFQKEDVVHASLKVDYFVSWKFDCKICGEDCVVTIPIANFDIHISMPPCPLGNADIPTLMQLPLGDSSPFEGVPLHIDGNLFVKRNGNITIACSQIKVDIE